MTSYRTRYFILIVVLGNNDRLCHQAPTYTSREMGIRGVSLCVSLSQESVTFQV